jgi:hypothetical protein
VSGNIRVVINPAGVALLPRLPQVQAAAARLAGQIEARMKELCPVSPPGPLHRSGALRASISSSRRADGSWRIGPHRSYGRYVNEGTPPHIIRSHGRWPLRNRETGQVFGPIVHHPGTRAVHFIERAAQVIDGEDIRV